MKDRYENNELRNFSMVIVSVGGKKYRFRLVLAEFCAITGEDDLKGKRANYVYG